VEFVSSKRRDCVVRKGMCVVEEGMCVGCGRRECVWAVEEKKDVRVEKGKT
jgi:hypothetical protein